MMTRRELNAQRQRQRDERIEKLRDEKGLSFAQIAILLGISKAHAHARYQLRKAARAQGLILARYPARG
jgi:hypothetical protein